MKVTNKLGLPASLVKAVEFSDRNTEGCEYTITELLKPPRVRVLEKQYAEKLEEDASDRIWALLGQAGHAVLQRYGKQTGKAIVEERATVEIEFAGRQVKIGGQLDYASTDDRTLTDFKFTSVWAVKDGCKIEWVWQTNLYRWLASKYGVHFDRIVIVCLLRDWSVREAASNPSYPSVQVKTFQVNVWSDQECERFIRHRLSLHEGAKVMTPDCTSEEMWEKPERFAVIKKGNQRATRVYDSKEDAINHAARDPKLRVDRRPAEHPRCESYCAVSKWCLQHRAWEDAQSLGQEKPEPELL